VRERVAIIDRSDRGLIVVSGRDRASYLQGLLTNDVVVLKPGEGCYAAYLTPQGRMIADVYVYELGDLMLLTLPLEQKDLVLAKLDQLIFSEEVQLGDVTDSFFTTAVVGPGSADLLAGILQDFDESLESLPEHGNRRGRFDGQPAIVTRISDTGQSGYDVYVESSQADAFRQALRSGGAAEARPETAEAVRIESGVPKFNRDMDQETIPLEAGIEARAISFSKGCYVGQEVIIRVMHRGHGRVARKLVGLVVDDETVPPAGARVTSEGREIGRVTSGAMSPALERPIVLAYLHRDFVAPSTIVTVNGAQAKVSALPFVQSSP
jgi:folate-binding protein YgfZ